MAQVSCSDEVSPLSNWKMMLKLLLMILIAEFKAECTINISTPVFREYKLMPEQTDIRFQQWLTFKLKAGYACIALKTHENADIMYEVCLGDYGDTGSVITRGYHDIRETSDPANLLDVSAFRPFWISWQGGVLAAGRGREVGSDVIVTWTDPSPLEVNYLAFKTDHESTAEWIIDDPLQGQKVRFELLEANALFTSQIVTETAASFPQCSRACFSLAYCKSFSYKQQQQECRMFDTTPRAQDLSQEPGWATWIIDLDL